MQVQLRQTAPACSTWHCIFGSQNRFYADNPSRSSITVSDAESTLSDELMETTTNALTTPTSNNLTICVSIAAAQTVIILFLVTGVVCCGVIFAKRGAFYSPL